VKRKCQDNSDNLKEMSCLTINFNLILTIVLIFVTVNIHNPSVAECTYGDAYDDGQ